MTSRTTTKGPTAAASVGPNYEPRLGTRKYRKTPRCIYFYYIDPTVSGSIWHYYYADREDEIDPEDMEAEIIKLANNARKPLGNQIPPPDGANFANIVWTRKSYVVFLIDDPDATFTTGNAIAITPESGTNYSFFDAKDFRVPSKISGKTVPVFYCINHMKKDRLNDLEKAKQRFRFTLPPGINIIPAQDNGGTNMGPPVPPP